MAILVTAFTPFGGDALNASQEILNALPETLSGVRLERLCLPVSFRDAPRLAIEAALNLHPEAVVCLGQAGGRDAVTPERVAVNLMDAAAPDNDGFQPVDAPVIPSAPAAYFSTLPVKAMVEAMQRLDVPARLSNTAGTYVCNALMFSMLHHVKGIPCGFIHVPYLAEQGKGSETPSLPKALVLRGVTACLQIL